MEKELNHPINISQQETSFNSMVIQRKLSLPFLLSKIIPWVITRRTRATAMVEILEAEASRKIVSTMMVATPRENLTSIKVKEVSAVENREISVTNAVSMTTTRATTKIETVIAIQRPTIMVFRKMILSMVETAK